MRGRNHVPLLVSEAVRGDNPLQRNDLPVDTCAPIVLAVWRSHAEEVLAAYAEVDVDEGGGEAFGSPPSFCSFRVCPRLPHSFAGRIEHPYDRSLVPIPGLTHFLCSTCHSFSSKCLASRARRSSQRTRYCVSQPNATLSGAASIWQRRTRPSGSTRNSPASSRTRRCFDIAGRLTLYGSASSLTVASPADSSSRIARRIGWANAPKTWSRSRTTLT